MEVGKLSFVGMEGIFSVEEVVLSVFPREEGEVGEPGILHLERRKGHALFFVDPGLKLN